VGVVAVHAFAVVVEVAAAVAVDVAAVGAGAGVASETVVVGATADTREPYGKARHALEKGLMEGARDLERMLQEADQLKLVGRRADRHAATVAVELEPTVQGGQ
jgi:hypothetical protein